MCKDIDEGKFEGTLKLLLVLVGFVLGSALVQLCAGCLGE